MPSPLGSLVDPFLDDTGSPRVVRGVTLISNAPRLAELAGRIGFETVWIEVEHGTAGWTEVEALCMATESGGAVPTVRIPDNGRTHVLRALEAGARILVVPMISSAEEAARIVEYGKFPPLGKRGYNTRSRGVAYGLEPPEIGFAKANDRTHFFAQIETLEGVRNLDSICGVEGLSGIFIGPGDLSAGMGKTGRFADPEVIASVVKCVLRGRELGKHVGILVVPGPLFDAAFAAGCDLLFAGGDITDLAKSWTALLEELS